MKFEWILIKNDRTDLDLIFLSSLFTSSDNTIFFAKNFFMAKRIFKLCNIFFAIAGLRFSSNQDRGVFCNKNIGKWNNFTIEKKIQLSSKIKKSVPLLNTPQRMTNFSLSKLFSFFLIFNYNTRNSQFDTNQYLKFFYLKSSAGAGRFFNINKIFNRWKQANLFIYNIFYYNFNIFIFGSPLFKTEILSLNWIYNDFDANAWRYYFNFFMFKNGVFDKKVEFFYQKLQSFGIDFYFVTDPSYHYKNIYFFNKFKFFTVALFDINLKFDLFSYSIPTSGSNFLFQFFFFKLLLTLYKESQTFRYGIYKKTWWTYRKTDFKLPIPSQDVV